MSFANTGKVVCSVKFYRPIFYFFYIRPVFFTVIIFVVINESFNYKIKNHTGTFAKEKFLKFGTMTFVYDLGLMNIVDASNIQSGCKKPHCKIKLYSEVNKDFLKLRSV